MMSGVKLWDASGDIDSEVDVDNVIGDDIHNDVAGGDIVGGECS